MAGTIVADTLTHSTAGSIATNYVVEGSAKAWVNFNGQGTVAIRDSLNISSLTDRKTGGYTTTNSSAFSSASVSTPSSPYFNTASESFNDLSNSGPITSSTCFVNNTESSSLRDPAQLSLSEFGELA